MFVFNSIELPTKYSSVHGIVVSDSGCDFESGFYACPLPDTTRHKLRYLVVGRTRGMEGDSVVLGPPTLVPAFSKGDLAVDLDEDLITHCEDDFDVIAYKHDDYKAEKVSFHPVGLLVDLLALAPSIAGDPVPYVAGDRAAQEDAQENDAQEDDAWEDDAWEDDAQEDE